MFSYVILLCHFLRYISKIFVFADDDSCASSPCTNNATCYDLLSGFVCKCLRGFYGPTCEQEVTTEPCAEVSTHTSETITSCPILEPEQQMNYCAENPCKNGGTCYNVTGDYLCVCPVGFTDQSCSQGIPFSNVLRSHLMIFNCDILMLISLQQYLQSQRKFARHRNRIWITVGYNLVTMVEPVTT